MKIKENWVLFFQKKNNRTEFIVTIIALIAILFLLTHFLNYIEFRTGVTLPDPILNLFHPINLTWLTFILIYSSLIIGIVTLVKEPARLLFAFQCYILLVVTRMIVMYVTPFNAPPGIIPLNDPVVQILGTGKLLTKDLFFSGHTATLFLLYLIAKNSMVKKIFLFAAVAVGVSVLLQHVHYTIDVLAAFYFTYVSYVLISLRGGEG